MTNYKDFSNARNFITIIRRLLRFLDYTIKDGIIYVHFGTYDVTFTVPTMEKKT